MKIALVGNPNVGKSTLFNALTHAHQHTGNWPGKTVSLASGYWQNHLIVDLPGTYSLIASSLEEKVTTNEILSYQYDVYFMVADATCLERNLVLLFQLLEMSHSVVLVLNLIDEAKRKHIQIDIETLKKELGIPVCALSATRTNDFSNLTMCIEEIKNIGDVYAISYPLPLQKLKEQNGCLMQIEDNETNRDICNQYGMSFSRIPLLCKTIYHHEAKTLTARVCKKTIDSTQSFLEKVFTGKITSWIVMALFLVLILWLTISFANIPSQMLGNGLFWFENELANFLACFLPLDIVDLLAHGIYRTLAWVVSVMLPPMAIFFPLFSILEDFGYLPRMAFNLDACFSKCGSCGKQALTMCMGLGCNAVGVMGTRIIEGHRNRLIALMTNAMVPCNGRFPMLIQISTMFFLTGSPLFQALFLLLVLGLSLFMSLLSGKLLCFFIKEDSSSLMLEMPDFRRPQFKKIIKESFFERTLKVLYRAIVVAAVAGLVIWLLAHIYINHQSLLVLMSRFLDPLGRFFGLDGVIILAFILGFPANEIVIPLMIMIYLGQGIIMDGLGLEALKNLLISQGWTMLTAFNVLVFTVFHWPCSTTLLTIKKETGSWKIVLGTFLLTTVTGFSLMLLIRIAYMLIF